MSTEHYFSETPGSEYRLKEITVTISGREVTLTTAGGVFSPDHIDQGTAVLLDHLAEAPAGGDILDLGCGWGPIALALASHSPKATVWAVDVNQRSLELTTANAKRMGLSNIKCVTPDQVPADLKFSGIWSNPPIRIGKDALHELLLNWLPRLQKDAEAYLVVQKNLGADSLHRWLESELPKEFNTIRVETSKSFRVLRVAHH
jgi:16S rRNA (guanine1207-N2)-methyltransferase